MISCAEAVRRLWEYIDGMVDDAEREAIEEHLGLCRLCCGEVEFAEELRRCLAARTDEEIPVELHRRLTAAIDAIVDRPLRNGTA